MFALHKNVSITARQAVCVLAETRQAGSSPQLGGAAGRSSGLNLLRGALLGPLLPTFPGRLVPLPHVPDPRSDELEASLVQGQTLGARYQCRMGRKDATYHISDTD